MRQFSYAKSSCDPSTVHTTYKMPTGKKPWRGQCATDRKKTRPVWPPLAVVKPKTQYHLRNTCSNMLFNSSSDAIQAKLITQMQFSLNYMLRGKLLFANPQAERSDVSARVRKSMCVWVNCDVFQLFKDVINLLAWTSKKQILRKLQIRVGRENWI